MNKTDAGIKHSKQSTGSAFHTFCKGTKVQSPSKGTRVQCPSKGTAAESLDTCQLRGKRV